jgi:hypothetical protein
VLESLQLVLARFGSSKFLTAQTVARIIMRCVAMEVLGRIIIRVSSNGHIRRTIKASNVPELQFAVLLAPKQALVAG